MPKKVSSDFSYTLTYLALKYERNRIFHPCRGILILSDFYRQALLTFRTGKLSISQRRDIISLMPKSDSDLTEVSSWRPITLLNVDYKILTKIIAKRIESSLPKLIHSDQTGFVKGRYIGQNIRLLNDIMAYTNIEKLPGILLFVDFEKAFDSIEWNLISKVLEVFNFGRVIKKWFSVIYNDAEPAAMNNGFLTNYFKISRAYVRDAHSVLSCSFLR